MAMNYGTEFSIVTNSRGSGSGASCIVGLKFSPVFPGIRQDSVLAKDSSGKTTATMQVYGIGQGPQAVLLPGVISTVAGSNPSRFGYGGDGGAATNALLRVPQGMAVDQAGNLFIADSLNNVIRRVDAVTGVISTVAGNNYYGYLGDGGSARSAELGSPTGVAVDGAGNCSSPTTATT